MVLTPLFPLEFICLFISVFEIPSLLVDFLYLLQNLPFNHCAFSQLKSPASSGIVLL